jgi:hypothetical protein
MRRRDRSKDKNSNFMSAAGALVRRVSEYIQKE